MTIVFTVDEDTAMDQVAIGECGSMPHGLADHVHKIAAHALVRRNADLCHQLAVVCRQRDDAVAQLAGFLQEVRDATQAALAEEQAHG